LIETNDLVTSPAFATWIDEAFDTPTLERFESDASALSLSRTPDEHR
jgi:hypothetical protein